MYLYYIKRKTNIYLLYILWYKTLFVKKNKIISLLYNLMLFILSAIYTVFRIYGLQITIAKRINRVIVVITKQRIENI